MKALSFGGTGFIGRRLVAALAKAAPRLSLEEITVVSRSESFNPELSRLLGHAGPGAPRGRVLACDLIESGPSDALREALADPELSLVLYSLQFPGHPVQNRAKGYTYARYDAGGLRQLLDGPLAKRGVRVVYISGAGAGQGRTEPWFRAKDAAEELLSKWALASDGTWLSLRPSLVFGAQDTSLNRIFGAAKLTRLCPLFGAGDTPLHPIWVEDLARAVVEFGAERALSGAHNLPGPVALTFRQTLAAMFRAGGLNPVPAFVPVPVGIAKAGARLLGVLPNPPLTAEAIDFLTTGPGMPLPVEEPAHGLLSRFQATCATPEAVFETYLKGG